MENERFQLRLRETNISDDALLEDLRRVSKQLGDCPLSFDTYGELGKHAPSTMARRFGSWNAAVTKAGLNARRRWNYTDEMLFENLENVWIALGRQPGRRDMATSPSVISETPYNRRFGSWNKALIAFVKFTNDETLHVNSPINVLEQRSASGSRDVNLRLRFKVMQRNRFTCVICGRSPATHPGLILHVDHKTPWSKGGRTVIENLQTLCTDCNLGKSNLE
jgi:hypothetical protein